MKLPNGTSGLVERTKVLEYLMNVSHSEGAGKAQFFLSMGFRSQEWQILANALSRIADEGEVVRVVESVHGTKYIIDGKLRAPNGRVVLVRTVWIREATEERPRLITAYPREE